MVDVLRVRDRTEAFGFFYSFREGQDFSKKLKGTFNMVVVWLFGGFGLLFAFEPGREPMRTDGRRCEGTIRSFFVFLWKKNTYAQDCSASGLFRKYVVVCGTPSLRLIL